MINAGVIAAILCSNYFNLTTEIEGYKRCVRKYDQCVDHSRQKWRCLEEIEDTYGCEDDLR